MNKELSVVDKKKSDTEVELVSTEKNAGIETEILAEIEKNEDNHVKINTQTYQHFGLIVLLITFGLLGLWGGQAPLSGAIVAGGFVVAASNAKEVQHLKGGIIEHIFIKEGDIVKLGTPIIKLNDTQEKAQLDLIKTQYYEAIGNISRLNSQLNEKKSIVFRDELNAMDDKKQQQRIITNQTKMFKALTAIHHKTIIILKYTTEQTKKQIDGLNNRVGTEKKQIDLYNIEINERERLYKLKLDSKVKLKEMERAKLNILGSLYDNEAEILKLSIHLAEIENQIILENQNYLNQVVSELQSTQAQVVDLKVRWLALEDTLKRTLIKSPGSGAVVGLEIDTIGAIISPTTLICEIIPQDKKFAIKAKVSLRDIDKVYPGQPVDIRFSSFNTKFTKIVSGNILRVSADSLEDNGGESYYEAKILVDDKGKEAITENEFEILPGMPVETMIKIGDRTFLSYLIKPFSDMLAKAFNEE